MTAEDDFVEEISDAAIATQEVGKAIGKPFELLFAPSAKVLGQHWAEMLEARLNKSQKDKVEKIIDGAFVEGDVIEIQNPPKASTVGALIDWIEAAKNLDITTNPNLTTAYQIGLAETLKGNIRTLSKIENLNENDISILIDPVRTDDREVLRNLAEAELIEISEEILSSKDRATNICFIAAIACLIFALPSVYTDTTWIFGDFNIKLASLIFCLFLGILGAAIYRLNPKSYYTPRRTLSGDRLAVAIRDAHIKKHSSKGASI